MILPDRYSRFNSYKPRKKIKPIIIVLLSLLIVGGVVFGILRLVPDKKEQTMSSADVYELWDQQKYEEVNVYCENALLENPMNITALTLNGFSYFYRGIAKFTLEDQLSLFDKSITNLRKAHAVESNPYRAQIEYVLGKVYYNKGKYYADLAIHYLESALNHEYDAIDTYEYLGLAYHSIGNYKRALEYLLLAKQTNPSDMLYLAIGQTYVISKDYANAESFLKNAILETKDQNVAQKGYSLLGQLYFDQSNFEMAIQQYEQIIKINPRSADAYYHLGVIYDTIAETIRARAQWRKALEIEPTHHGALLKLYN